MEPHLHIVLDLTAELKTALDGSLCTHAALSGMQLRGAKLVLLSDGTIMAACMHPCGRIYPHVTPEAVLGVQAVLAVSHMALTGKDPLLELGPVLKKREEQRALAALASGERIEDIVDASRLCKVMLSHGVERLGIAGVSLEQFHTAIVHMLESVDSICSVSGDMARRLPPDPPVGAERRVIAEAIRARARWLRLTYSRLRDQAVEQGLATSANRAEGARKLLKELLNGN